MLCGHNGIMLYIISSYLRRARIKDTMNTWMRIPMFLRRDFEASNNIEAVN